MQNNQSTMMNPFQRLFEEMEEMKGMLTTLIEHPNLKPGRKYYTVQEVADMLKIDYQTVRAHIQKGNLKAEKIGRFYRIYHHDLEESLQEVKSLKYKR